MDSVNQLTLDVMKPLNVTTQWQSVVDSTNTWAKNGFNPSMASPCVYLADEQTQGRGRNGRSWVQKSSGHSLLSTWCFRVDQPMQPIFSPLVGLAVFNALKTHWPEVSFCLKAPNDIFVGSQKLAGLLIEMQTGAQPGTQDIFIGLGLNVLSAPAVDQPTTFLMEATTVNGRIWENFIVSLLEQFKNALELGKSHALNGDTCLDIQRALSVNPDFAVDTVLADGSLVQNKRTIQWWDL